MRETDVDRTEYEKLIKLAEDRNIKCAEARGLDTRRGVRFSRDGQDWIVLDSDLSVKEKTRAVGFLLQNEPADAAVRAGLYEDRSEARSAGIVHTLCC